MRAIKNFLKRSKVLRDLHQAVKAPQAIRRDADLAAIEGLTLPTNVKFQEVLAPYSGSKGCSRPFLSGSWT